MTPEDCQGCPYFDGEDICEASRVKLAFGSMVFPIPISQIKVCEHFHDEDESDVLPTSISQIIMRNTSKDKEDNCNGDCEHCANRDEWKEWAE